MELRTDARANRERIVEAAREAFAERGLGVEMREIAERAGVAVGTIYRHFPGKEELLTAICSSLLDEAVADADACFELPDPIEALTALLAGNLRRAARYGSLIGAMIGGELPRHHLQEIKAGAAVRRQKGRVRQLVQRGIDQGRLRADLDAGIAAAMLEGTALPWSYAAIADGRDPLDLARTIVDTLLRGAAREQRHERDIKAAGLTAATAKD